MNDLPRARALVRLDGPGHIMPVEPVTPPDSRVLHVVHSPAILAAVAIALLFVAARALNLLGAGLQSLAIVPGARFLVPIIGAGAIAGLYAIYVRAIERRPAIEELAIDGAPAELATGFAGGLALALAGFAALAVAGAVHVIGVNPVRLLVYPLIAQTCTAVIAEIILCGLGFRLAERLLGSWYTLLFGMIVIGAVQLAVNQGGSDLLIAAPAAAVEGALLFAAPYMLTRRLWAAIGLYAAQRFAQGALYGSAAADTGPQGLLATYLTGPDWLTGGHAGSDGSLPALVIAALSLAALLTLAARRGRIVRPAWRRGRVGGKMDRHADLG